MYEQCSEIVLMPSLINIDKGVTDIGTFITEPKSIPGIAKDVVKVGVKVTYNNGERWANIIQCSLAQLKEAIAEMETRVESEKYAAPTS